MDALDASTLEYVNSGRLAAEYDDYFSRLNLFKFDTQFLDGVFEKPGRLVDIGCGTGRHVLHFARRAFDAVGIDLSPSMLRQARDKLDEYGLSASLIRADFLELDFLPDETFDYAICMFSTLGMIRGKKNRARFLSGVRRILRNGGKIVFHAHNRYYDPSSPGWLSSLIKSYILSPLAGMEIGDKRLDTYRGLEKFFIHTFTPREIKILVRESGFALEEMCYLSPSRSAIIPRKLSRMFRANGFLVVIVNE